MRFAALAASYLGLSAPLHAYVLKRDITPHSEDADEADMTVDEDGQSAAYLEALSLSETDPGDDDIGAASIRLFGFNECTNPERVGNVPNAKAQIYSGWQQAQQIMKVQSLVDGDVDFNTAGALEYLGPPGFNINRQSDMNGIFRNFATLTPAWWPFGWYIHARCDDPKGLCCNDNVKAYTTTKDDDSGYARINFCKPYFTTPTLKGAINEAKTSIMPIQQVLDMSRYWNTQGHIWAHELMHIDWVTNAKDTKNPPRWNYGHNTPVTDLLIEVDDNNGNLRTGRAYGALGAKILALWPENTGDYTIRNADNLALFMTSQYVQEELGAYPHYPRVGRYVPTMPPWDSSFIANEDGTVTLNASHPDADQLVEADSASTCAFNEDPDPTPIHITSFASDSEYPSEYLDQVAAWSLSEDGPAESPQDDSAEEPDNGTLDPVYLDNELGLVTCFAPHDAGDETYYFTLETGNQAIADFCSSTASAGISPGLVESTQAAGKIDVKAARDDSDDGCPPLDVTSDDFVDTCTERLSVALNGCDTTNPGAADAAWKQGGTFYRDCMSWSLKLALRPE